MRFILIAVIATLAGFLGWVDGKTGVAEPTAAVKPASGERRAGEFPNLTVRVGNETRGY